MCLFSKQQGYFSICGLLSNPRKWIKILSSYHLLCRDLITNTRITRGIVVMHVCIFSPCVFLNIEEIALSLNLNESRWIQNRCFLVLFSFTNCSYICCIECPRCNDQLVLPLLGVNIHGSGFKLNVYLSNCFIVEFG